MGLTENHAQAHGHIKILGGGMVGTNAGDMVDEVALAIEMDEAVSLQAPRCPDEARTGNGSGFVLAVINPSSQSTVYLNSICVGQTQTLQPALSCTHAAVPNRGRPIKDLT